MKDLCKTFAFLMISLSFPATSTAQWVQTNGPYGGQVTAFAVNGGDLYAGTAEFGGVFLSTNSGADWKPIGLANMYVSALTVSGTNLFAGANGGGVFRYNNDGASWTAVNNGLTSTNVLALAVSGPNLVAGTWDRGICLSANNGDTWSPPPGMGYGYITVLAVDGPNLYAGGGSGVILSANNGNTWTSVNAGPLSGYVSTLAVNGGNLFAGTYDKGVFLCANNGPWQTLGLANVHVRALAQIGTTLYAGTDAGVFLYNSGTIWTAKNAGLTNTDVLALAAADQNFFAGTNNGGVYLSPDGGANWSEKNNGLTATTINALLVSGANLFAGTSGKGVCLSADNGKTWSERNNGLTNTTVNALAVKDQNLFAGTYGGGVFLSTDDGKNWAPRNNGLNNALVLALAVNDPYLFAGTDGGGVYFSTDGGANWSDGNKGLSNLRVRCFGLNSSNLFAGTYWTGVYRSPDNGANWTAAGLQWSNMNAFALIGANLFAAGDTGLFRTTDNGVNWIEAGLTNKAVRALAVSGTDIIAGLWGWWEVGDVLLSGDNGAHWAQVNTGLTGTSTYALAVIGTNLFAGTAGRGVWVSTINNTPTGQNVSVQPVDAGTGTSPATVTFDSVAGGGKTSLSMTNSGPPPPGGFQLGDPPVYYDIKTTAQFLGPIQVCLNYSAVSFQIPDNVTLWHYEQGNWVNTMATVDTARKTICCTVTSLSPFAIVEPSTIIVKIDIIPGLSSNFVIPNTVLPIPVGIFSSNSFDASKIDISSVRFGRAGAQALLGKGVKLDLNCDRKLDLLLAFNTKQTGIQPGDISATLFGKTLSGQWFVGRDRVQTSNRCFGKEPVWPEETIDVPVTYSLGQNYPNPFNPTTKIQFSIVDRQLTIVKVYDVLGSEVATLVNEVKEPGTYTVQFDGSKLASGVYLYRLQAGDFVQSKKLTILK